MVNDHEAARTLELKGQPTNQGLGGPQVDRRATHQLGSGQSPHERKMQPYDLRTPKSGRDWVSNLGSTHGGPTSGLRHGRTPIGTPHRDLAAKGSPARAFATTMTVTITHAGPQRVSDSQGAGPSARGHL